MRFNVLELKMKKIMVALLLVMSISAPVFVSAQDVTDPAPTIEVFETPTALPTETSTPEPSATPAPTETPVPVPPPTPPIDQGLVIPQILIIGIVALGAVVTVAWVGIINAAKGLPEWSRPLLLSNLKSGVDTLDNLTDGPVSDAGITLLRQKIAELERELNEVKIQANTNAQNIVTTNQAVSKVIGNG
jgi:hypothetical protein